MAVVYLFGDSITYGAWDIERGGWAARLRNHLDGLQLKDSSLYFLCYCLGVPGETTDGLAKRFEAEIGAREREGEDAIFVFAYGANDSVFVPSTKGFRVPEERFVKNMESALDAARAITDKIVMLNVTPADEAICASRYGAKDKVRLNANVVAYNALITEIGKRRSIPIVDVYGEYAKGDFRQFLSEDGLHPNEKGHQLIFEKVKVAIDGFL